MSPIEPDHLGLPGLAAAPAAVPRRRSGCCKIEIAKALAAALDTEPIRLQCYKAYAAQALYE
jgi:hypothetical protein